MAEFVQLRKEKWTDTLHYLRKLDLFKKAELREITSTIEFMEYKVQTPNRKVDDVLAYIAYECKLLKTLQKRRKIAEKYDRCEEIDRFIYNEIYTQFGSAEINFQHDINYWNARIEFISTIVPPENREVEFNRIFRRALDYCGKGHLELYQECVNFCWTFRPSLQDRLDGQSIPKKRKLKNGRKTISTVMSSVRDITKDALRNFSRSPEAWIWVTTTEFEYLTKLLEEQQLPDHQLQEEIEKTEAMIKLLFENFKSTYQAPLSYIQYFDAVKKYDYLPEAEHLCKKIMNKIVSIQPKTLEIFSWLIGKAVEEKKIDECLERVEQALSSTLPKIKILHVCLKKLDVFFEALEDTNGRFYNCFVKLVEFCCKLLDKDNEEWSQVSSELYHTSRVNFIKRLSKLEPSLPKSDAPSSSESDQKLSKIISTFRENNPLKGTLISSVKKFPTNFFMVKELIMLILSQNEKPIKPVTICKYLKDLDLQKLKRDEEKEDEVRKLLILIYYAFITDRNLNMKVGKLLKVPGTEDIRIIHLKTMYVKSVKAGRSLYAKLKDLTSDWRFSLTVVEIETEVCRGRIVSSTFLQAIQNATRLTGASSTSPWKTCIISLFKLGKDSQASQLLQRALKLFNNGKDREKYEEMLMFAKMYK